MGGGNGKKRLLMPGQNVTQGQELRPGAPTPQEMENRQKLEMELIMLGNVHQARIAAGDVAKTLHSVEAFADAPDRDRQLQEALLIHRDYAEAQLRILKTVRSKLKKCAPFKGMKDLKFGSDEDTTDV